MEQPKIRIADTNGKDWGVKKVMSMSWDNNGRLWVITVDFMESGNSCDYAPFYCYSDSKEGEFINVHGNLKGKLITT